MIRSGQSIRPTAPEVEMLDAMGIDATGVTSPTCAARDFLDTDLRVIMLPQPAVFRSTGLGPALA